MMIPDLQLQPQNYEKYEKVRAIMQMIERCEVKACSLRRENKKIEGSDAQETTPGEVRAEQQPPSERTKRLVKSQARSALCAPRQPATAPVPERSHFPRKCTV